MRNVQIFQKKIVFDDFFRIEEALLKYEKFTGEMSNKVRRLSFERGDSVAAIIFNTESRKVIMVNQFKYPTYAKGDGWVIEATAGILEEGENPEEAVTREVLEETGYQIDYLEHISTFFLSPGGSSERIILYYAEVSKRVLSGGGVESEGEDIDLVELELEQLWDMLGNMQLSDAKTIIAAMWLKQNGRKCNSQIDRASNDR